MPELFDLLAGIPELDPRSSRFLDELADYLMLTHDPRLTLTENGGTISDAAGASADFCMFLSRVTAAGFKSSDWRAAL